MAEKKNQGAALAAFEPVVASQAQPQPSATGPKTQERPIVLHPHEVRAVLAGTQTQLRRVVTDQTSRGNYRASELLLDDPRVFVDKGPSPAGNPGQYLHAPVNALEVERRRGWKRGDCCDSVVERLYPAWFPGDRLWVRETLRLDTERDEWLYDIDRAPILVDEDDHAGLASMYSWAHHKEGEVCVSIHMPRWASRITLEITEVRVERVQDITEEDAKAEGIVEPAPVHGQWCDPARGREGHWSYRKPFADLWDSINEKRGFGWATDPWLWVLSFRRIGG